ncbi:MAG: hypothetical protein RLO03_13960 [Balneola sp.]
MNISGAEKVILYNVDTLENYEFTKISTDSKYNKKSLHEEDFEGNLIYVEDEFSLVLVLFDEVDVVSIQVGISAGNKFTVDVIGIGEYIGWNKESEIIIDDEFRFQSRQKNVVSLRLKTKGKGLNIGREPLFQLLAEGAPIQGFIGLNTTDSIGVKAKSIPESSVGESDSFSWMGVKMETVILQTT